MAKRKYPAIPSHVKTKSKRDYEVTFIDQFKDLKQLGECRQDPPQIVIKTGQSSKEEYSTFIHEVLHALSFDYDINLTESQVLKLEKALLNLLKLNKLI